MTDRGVVVGVGNPTMGDDGLGRAVVRHLVDQRPAVRATFAGTTAMLALEAMDGADRAVVVDAIDATGPPRTVHRVKLDGGTPTEVMMHDFTFAEAVRACSGAYDVPDRIVVVGVVPDRVAPTIGLSGAVRSVVPDAAAVAAAELCGDRHDGGTRFVDGTWYCVDCERRIDADAVDEHEREGHSVRGRLRPERLLSQDPWQASDDATSQAPSEGGDD